MGSKPEEGSSNNNIFESPIKEIAKDNFLLLPPDKFFENLPASKPKAHYFMIL